MVETLLQYVPEEYLGGLQSILLTNLHAVTGRKKKQKTWSRNRKVRLVEVLGYYSPAVHTSKAFIVLNVDNMCRNWDGLLAKLPLVRYMPVCEVLYHEIGHHIHAEHQPVYKGKEDVAENWTRKLRAGFIRKRYWYLMPILYPLGKIVRVFERERKK
jgi:hypothetical protein